MIRKNSVTNPGIWPAQHGRFLPSRKAGDVGEEGENQIKSECIYWHLKYGSATFKQQQSLRIVWSIKCSKFWIHDPLSDKIVSVDSLTWATKNPLVIGFQGGSTPGLLGAPRNLGANGKQAGFPAKIAWFGGRIPHGLIGVADEEIWKKATMSGILCADYVVILYYYMRLYDKYYSGPSSHGCNIMILSSDQNPGALVSLPKLNRIVLLRMCIKPVLGTFLPGGSSHLVSRLYPQL